MQAHDVDRVKIDDHSYNCECAECGKRFEASRSDASFCSPKCRVAYSRRPAKLAHAIEAVDAFGEQILDYSRRYSRNDRMFQAMVILQRKINAAVANFENG
jgi:endogenous inhibitor of DNA gyrase (YacG/DUF329 family)